MPDVYGFMLDAGLSKAFDVWAGCLDARTSEDPRARARLRALLESARAAAAEGDAAEARAQVAELYDEAAEAALPWAPSPPRPCEADGQARDYAKDALRHVLPVDLREELDTVALHLRVTTRRLLAAPGLDAASREDVVHLAARAGMALDLAHPTAARHQLERLQAVARRWGLES
ncbi:hypothetical protein ACIF8T_25485 [Streptomyces sp. NPDC085946]|uniref:hypothetical protein n=1 Tax=Streptomyces sp. NPDC085946 TaxID=3365744 RepID=UPI0037D58AA2